VAVLGDDDLSGCDQAAGGGAGWLHEGFPVAAGGVGFVARVAGDELRGFRGADGFASVTVGFALGEELEDGGFEGGVLFAGAVAAAGFGAKLGCPSRGSFARSSGRGACRFCRVFLCAGWGGRVLVCGRAWDFGI
jgi:hypothetical protein